MYKKTTALLISLALSGCANYYTTPKTLIQIPTKEQIIEENSQFLQHSIDAGLTGKKLDLVKVYIASNNPEIRQKATPILNELLQEKDKDVDAILLATQLGLSGYLGEVSDENFTKYSKLLSSKKPDYFNKWTHYIQKNKTFITKNLKAFADIYQQTYHLCEQPLNNMPKKLELNDKTYLVLDYLNTCLLHFSTNKNITQRLNALSQLEHIKCQKEHKKICLADGYQVIKNGRYTQHSSFVVAAALKKIYDSHESELKPKTGWKKRYPSGYTSSQVIKSYKLYDDKKLQQAIVSLETYLNTHKQLSAYDIAYVKRVLFQLLVIQDDKSKIDTALTYAEESLSANELNYKDQKELFDLVAKSYLNHKKYGQYIKMVSRYILKYQNKMTLIPSPVKSS